MMKEDSNDDIFYDAMDDSDVSEAPPVPPHVDSDNPSPTNSSRYGSSLSMQSSPPNAHYISSDESDYADVEDLNDSEDLNLSGELGSNDRSDETDDGDESNVDDESNGDYNVEDCDDIADDDTDTDESKLDYAVNALPPLMQLPWPVSNVRLDMDCDVSSVRSLPTEEEIISLSTDSDKEKVLPFSSVSNKKPSENSTKHCVDFENEVDCIVDAITEDEVVMFKIKWKNSENKTDWFDGSVVYEKWPQAVMKYYEERYKNKTDTT